MPGSYVEIFRRHCRPLDPLATGERPVLAELASIRSVLFDLYGTLFVSGSGEVGTADAASSQTAFGAAMAAVGIHPIRPLQQSVECLFQTIKTHQARARKTGIDYPEVQIVDVWRELLAELGVREVVDRSESEVADAARLAVEYEARANPCWPMPHVRPCLRALGEKSVLLGIISNAQFYTRELFEALLGAPAERWGFGEDLQYYSYVYGRAKPGLELFEMAAEGLQGRGISPGEVLYVGNDMLNDIMPAYRVGFRTALFAGDARSLRRRHEDGRSEGISPDLVLTDLDQLADCL